MVQRLFGLEVQAPCPTDFQDPATATAPANLEQPGRKVLTASTFAASLLQHAVVIPRSTEMLKGSSGISASILQILLYRLLSALTCFDPDTKASVQLGEEGNESSVRSALMDSLQSRRFLTLTSIR